MRIPNTLTAFLFGLCCVSAYAIHPADTNSDSALTQSELLAYAAGAPDPELLQQAENIWKHGGAYVEDSTLGNTLYIPNTSGIDFVAIDSYLVDFGTAYEISLPVLADRVIAHFYLTEDPSAYYAAEVVDTDTGVSFALPPHPVDADAGGTIYLEFTQDYGTSSETLHTVGFVKLAGLPAVQPGSFNQFMGKVSDMVTEIERLEGIDYSDYFVGGSRYFGPFEDVYEEVEVAIIRLLQDPNMDGGLQSVLAELATDPDALEQLDQLYDFGDINAVIDQFTTQFEPAVYESSPASAFRSESRSIMSAERIVARASAARTFYPRAEISNEATLALRMREQFVAEEMLKDPIFSLEAGVGNTALGLAGVPGKVMSASFGLTTAALQLKYERKANTYPSKARIDAQFSVVDFYQDDCGKVGNWSYTMTADSNGWKADQALLNFALTAGGTLAGTRGGGADTSFVTEAGKATGDFIRDSGLKEVSKYTDFAEVPAEQWDTPDSSSSYAEVVQSGDVLLFSGDIYFPEKTGSSSVFVSARGSGDASFPPGRVTPSDPITISLLPAQLLLSGEPPTRYEAGMTYTLTAQVTELSTDPPQISWSADGGQLGTPQTLGNGSSQVEWTAPDPAQSDVITITADLDTQLCYPVDTPQQSVVTSTQGGGRYQLQVSPEKGCYAVGETINLTYVDLDDSTNKPITNFDLSGSGSIFQTSPNTAILSYDSAGSVGMIVSLDDDPSQFELVDFVYGCADLELVITDFVDPDPDTLFINTDEYMIQLFGSITKVGGVITVNFSAQDDYNLYRYPMYQEELADWQALPEPKGDPPEPPVLGAIGSANGQVYNDPLFRIQFAMPFTTDDCNMPAIPPFETLCYFDDGAEPSPVVTDGIAGNYLLDPALAGQSTQVFIPDFDTKTDYTFNLVPEN